VESENLSLRQMLQENQVQHTLHPPNNVIHAEILDLKNKHEEIQNQQATLKQETKTHIQSWAQVVRRKDNNHHLAEVEEVVQAKLREEHTKRARELNLKIRGLPLPLPSLHPVIAQSVLA
jgi:hypothetical protein